MRIDSSIMNYSVSIFAFFLQRCKKPVRSLTLTHTNNWYILQDSKRITSVKRTTWFKVLSSRHREWMFDSGQIHRRMRLHETARELPDTLYSSNHNIYEDQNGSGHISRPSPGPAHFALTHEVQRLTGPISVRCHSDRTLCPGSNNWTLTKSSRCLSLKSEACLHELVQRRGRDWGAPLC